MSRGWTPHKASCHPCRVSNHGRHLNPKMTVRPPADLKERAKEAAIATGNPNLNAHVLDFLRWFVGDIDELKRPKDETPRLPDE